MLMICQPFKDHKGIACLFENLFQFLSAQESAYNGALEMSVNFPDWLYIGIVILPIFIRYGVKQVYLVAKD